MNFYQENADKVLSRLDSRKEGLSAREAAEKMSRCGKNVLEAEKGTPLFLKFLAQLKDPMILILLAAALISGALAFIQNESAADMFIILFVIIVNAVLGVYQESKAEKAIEALQKMSAATAKVVRDGAPAVVPAESLVPGDIILLEAGDAVPADARLLSAASLKIEEANLTGESVPVSKCTDAIEKEDVPLGDRKNMVYMGSSVSYGRGCAVVTATGMNTEMGKIAGALSMAKEGKTPLQHKLSQLSAILTRLVLLVSVAVFAVQLLRRGGLDAHTVLDSFMIAVSLAVAAIPEGLAAVVTVVLSIGVTNMSRRNAIIRKLTAVETLGCAQIICSDKTGTLTQNKMTVVDFFGEDEAATAMQMALCSDAELREGGEVVGEPTEAALVVWANRLGKDKNDLKCRYKRIGEAPFDSERKMMSTVHETNGNIIQFTKGAPDVVLERCTHFIKDGKMQSMTADYKKQILDANKAMADKALRVLCAAIRSWDAVPEGFEPASLENSLCFTGLCGMIDPVRPEVRSAIVKCREAGILPVMITGDHVDTAAAIARELGILEGGRIAITGAQLDKISDADFEKEIENIGVYARVQPEHKTRIVSTWQKLGYVTAMTGDGVNDAPSIKKADIGVGMGITGTDVTKNVADMVLADDNFATIVGASEEGRRIYDNIRKAISFLLSSNMSEVLCIFSASLMGFSALAPAQLLWINLITDCFPALALGTEKAEADIMKRKPRQKTDSIFADGMGTDIVYQSIIIAALVLAAYFIGTRAEFGRFLFADSAHGSTMAFLTMSLTELFHSLNMRSRTKSIFRLPTVNIFLYLAAVFSAIATAAVTLVPSLARIFGFTALTMWEYLAAAGLSLLIIPIVEAVKLFKRHFRR